MSLDASGEDGIDYRGGNIKIEGDADSNLTGSLTASADGASIGGDGHFGTGGTVIIELPDEDDNFFVEADWDIGGDVTVKRGILEVAGQTTVDAGFFVEGGSGGMVIVTGEDANARFTENASLSEMGDFSVTNGATVSFAGGFAGEGGSFALNDATVSLTNNGGDGPPAGGEGGNFSVLDVEDLMASNSMVTGSGSISANGGSSTNSGFGGDGGSILLENDGEFEFAGEGTNSFGMSDQDQATFANRTGGSTSWVAGTLRFEGTVGDALPVPLGVIEPASTAEDFGSKLVNEAGATARFRLIIARSSETGRSTTRATGWSI